MTRTSADYSFKGKRVWVAGHRGMVGSALVRRLAGEDCEILTIARDRLDLRDPSAVLSWLQDARPAAVFLAAAKVGGILANDTYPAQFLHDNLAIQTSVIDGAYRVGVEKLLFLGSSCIYPKHALQPMREEALLTGPLEPTNQWYAVAKIAGLKMAEAYRREYEADFISAMPTNLYGPGDNYDPASSHVLAALIRKVAEAKATRAPHVVVWGSGTPLREFMHADDCADALVFLMRHYSSAMHVNVGSGDEIAIAELASTIAGVAGYSGSIELDRSKPDGTPRKLLDSSRLRSLGWRPSIALRDGIVQTYAEFEGTLQARAAARGAA